MSSVLLSPVTGCMQEASREAINLSPERGEAGSGERRKLRLNFTGGFPSSWKCSQRNREESHLTVRDFGAFATGFGEGSHSALPMFQTSCLSSELG